MTKSTILQRRIILLPLKVSLLVLLLGGCAPLSYLSSAASGAMAINREDRITDLENQVRYLTSETTAAGD